MLRIDHVELFVPERFAAAEWFAEIFGFAIIDACRHWAEDPRGPLMLDAGDGTKLALFDGQPPEGREIVGYRRVAFAIDGAGFLAFVERWRDRLPSTDGATPVKDHTTAFSIYFNDPWGHPLEVTTYDHEAVRGKL